MEDQEYLSVNNALNEYFFRGRFEMLPVYLDLEGEAEDEVAEALGIDPDELGDFIGLTAARSLRFDNTDPYVDQARWLVAWSRRGRAEPPPFTTLLCALSIAAERMGVDENFSANNYSERQFEILGAKDATSQQKLRQYAKSTRQFWRGLNMWLAENDFRFGRPTARAVIPHWKFASFGLSQALVRDADRKRFPGLFEKYDLVPGEPVPEAEMTLLLHDWMSSHGPTGPTIWLKKLWQTGDLRPRVVLAALDAFEAWERVDGAARSGPTKTRMQWQLGFSGFPRKRARLSLAVYRGGQAERLEENGAGAQAQDHAVLEEGLEPGVHFLGPVDAIDLDMLLLKSRNFTGAESGTAYAYVAKPIVVLARAPDGAHYKEVSRASLFEEHAILCHEAWLEKVQGHLAKCARPGYAVLGPSDMAGIPKGWHVLRGVEIVRAVDDATVNFHALSPIGSAAAVACVEGLKLGHGTWHRDAPPLVQATSEKPDASLAVFHERFGEKDEEIAGTGATGDFMEVSLASTRLAAGANLRAVVKQKSTELTETSFSLRSADIPRPLSTKRLVHALDGTGFALEPVAFGDAGATSLEGAVLTGTINLDCAEGTSPSVGPSAEAVPQGSPEMEDELEWAHSEDAENVAAESCVIRGYHHWVYEAFEKGDDKYDAKMAECKNCRERALSRTREVAKGNAKKMAQGQVATPATRRAKAMQDAAPGTTVEETGVSLDTLFDGLCYLGHGSWPAFQRLAASVSTEPWFAQSLAGDLQALGHLEMRGGLVSRGGEWSIAPPALVVGMDGNAYLSGFQSETLRTAVGEALAGEGANYSPVEADDQPTVHRWTGLSDLELEKLLIPVRDVHGRPVTVSRGLAATISMGVPSFAEVFSRATPIHIEEVDGLAKFDTRAARWMRVNRMEGAGAYRIGLHGTRYVFRDGSGATRQVGHQVAKTLAARAAGDRLHGYDLTRGTFTAALGVEPPWLYARALVASGGALPRGQDGRVVFDRVEPAVGAMILNKMYGKDESSG